jgi:hypothetical protein
MAWESGHNKIFTRNRFLNNPFSCKCVRIRLFLLSNGNNKINSINANRDSKGGEKMAKKPSEKEEEYFARMEFDRRKKIEEEKTKNITVEERKRLKELHFLKCPKCGMDLIEIDFKTIKVDKCSHCQGIWLDAGEFETVSALEQTVLDKFFNIFK